MKFTFERRLIIGFACTIGIFISIGFYAFKINQNTIRTSLMVSHTNEVLYRIQGVLTKLVDIDAGQRGYMLTGDSSFLGPHIRATSDVDSYIYTLKKLVGDNRRQVLRCDTLEEIAQLKIARANNLIEKRSSRGYLPAVDSLSMIESKIIMGKIRTLVSKMEQEEKQLLRSRNQKNEAEVKHFNTTFFLLMVADLVILTILFFTIFTSINARRHAEDRVKTLNENLEKNLQELDYSNKELEAFSYSVSHDLRAPLRSIDGYTRILQEDYSHNFDEEGRRVMHVISRNAQKMGNLIDDLLAFSRLNKANLVKNFIDMNQLVHSILTDLIDEKKQVEVHIETLAPSYGDINMITQVWVNLLSNAIKYSSSRSSQIISIGSTSSIDENVYFVKDNGVGFDMQYVNKLFGVFQRLHNSNEFEGTGVGLAIIQRILSKHKGKVWAKAELGKGATFYFMLPNSN